MWESIQPWDIEKSEGNSSESENLWTGNNALISLIENPHSTWEEILAFFEKWWTVNISEIEEIEWDNPLITLSYLPEERVSSEQKFKIIEKIDWCVLQNNPQEVFRVADLYRRAWQIEIAIDMLKSLMKQENYPRLKWEIFRTYWLATSAQKEKKISIGGILSIQHARSIFEKINDEKKVAECVSNILWIIGDEGEQLSITMKNTKKETLEKAKEYLESDNLNPRVRSHIENQVLRIEINSDYELSLGKYYELLEKYVEEDNKLYIAGTCVEVLIRTLETHKNIDFDNINLLSQLKEFLHQLTLHAWSYPQCQIKINKSKLEAFINKMEKIWGACEQLIPNLKEVSENKSVVE